MSKNTSIVPPSMQHRAPLSTFILACLSVWILVGSTTEAQWASWNWKKIPLSSPYNGGYYLGIYFLPTNPNLGWICGRSQASGGVSYVLRTTNGGQNWLGTTIDDCPQLESIYFVNAKVGYCSGTNQLTNKGGIFRSTDGGVSWSEITPLVRNSAGQFVKPGLWGNNFYDELNGLVIGGGCGAENQLFFKTTDGGNSWTLAYYAEDATGLSHVKMLDPNGLCYASSSGFIWKSVDGGRHWSKSIYTGPPYWQENLKLYNNSFCVATAGTDCDGQSGPYVGDIRFSTDLGLSWKRTSTGAAMFGTFLLNDSVAWAAGFDRHVMRTSDRGATWRIYNCGLESPSDYDDLFFINDTLGFVVGDGIYRTVRPDAAPDITIQGDTVLCKGDSVTLKGPDGYTQYVWSNGHVGQYLVVTESGDYSVQVILPPNCPLMSNPVHVTVYAAPSTNLRCSSAKNHICDQDSVVLSVQGKFASIQWSTGETSDSIVVRSAGMYTVRVSGDHGCLAIDSLYVSAGGPIHPTISGTGISHLCEGDSLRLAAQPGFSSYRWNTGSTSRTIDVRGAGQYWVMVRDSFGCAGVSDTVSLQVDPNPIDLSAYPGSVFVIDSTRSGETKCDSLIIHNLSTDSLRISQAVLFRNMEFSVPQAQLVDFVIPPLGSKGLLVCYRPSTFHSQQDTMLIGDFCHRLLFIRSAGIPDTVKGVSECHIPLTGSTISIGTIGLKIYPAYPNPVSGDLTVPVMLNREHPEVWLEIQSLVGEVLKNEPLLVAGALNSSSTGSSDPAQGMTMLYTSITTSLRDIPDGVYQLSVRCGSQIQAQLFVVQH